MTRVNKRLIKVVTLLNLIYELRYSGKYYKSRKEKNQKLVASFKNVESNYLSDVKRAVLSLSESERRMAKQHELMLKHMYGIDGKVLE